MRKSSKIYGLKVKKLLQPFKSEKMRMLVEDSNLKIRREREFVLSMKLAEPCFGGLSCEQFSLD